MAKGMKGQGKTREKVPERSIAGILTFPNTTIVSLIVCSYST